MGLLEAYGYRVRRDAGGVLYYVWDDPEHGKPDMSDKYHGLKSITSQATYDDPLAKWSDQTTEGQCFLCVLLSKIFQVDLGLIQLNMKCSKIPHAAETTMQEAVAADVAASLNRIQELNLETDVDDEGFEMAPRPTRSVLDIPNFSAPQGVDEEIASRGSASASLPDATGPPPDATWSSVKVESQKAKPKTLRTKL